MTPAINLLIKHKVIHKVLDYQHDSNAQSYGLEAAEKLKLNPLHVFKTLVVENEQNQLAVAIIPVSSKLNMKAIAKTLRCKKIHMADPKAVERSTGYVLGGVSPLGQKKKLKTIIDGSAQALTSIYVSAGKRGLEIAVCPNTLADILDARFSEISL